MALDFPSSPTNGQTFTGPNGVLWAWDGVKWTNATQPGGTAYAPIDTPVFIGNPQAPNPPPGDSDTSIATTSFVTSAIAAAGGSVTIAATPPTVTNRALWWDSTGGQLYVGYDDGVGPIQWVAASNITGLAYTVTKADVAASTATALNNVGRNLIHNSMFNIAQRGAGPFTAASGFTLDRWNVVSFFDAVSFSQAAVGDSGRAAIGDEAATFSLSNTFTGNAAGGASNRIQHAIEDVRRLAGKTVTVSFWAVASSGTPKLGINMVQNFGTGGGASASIQVLPTGNSVTLSTTWARYSTTIAIPAISGIKTVGTNNDHFTQLQFWYSSGATANAAAGNIGVQFPSGGTISIWGVQLELGTVATPLEKLDPVTQLQQAQRFYCTGYASSYVGTINATIAFGCHVTFPVTMRTIPNPVTLVGTTYLNASGATAGTITNNAALITAPATANGGQAAWATTYTASADL